ncbi:MAG: hypothetical protein IKT40_07380 [Bacilli bacterium]|nr:hypothetical protein [Bacilli bacterium]
MSLSRYTKFINNGTMDFVPFIPIPKRKSDYYINYKQGRMRMDILSYEYYNDPNYGWLIMQANPEYGSLEYKIPNNAIIRIPYPLETVITQYQNDIDTYKELYGTK